MGSFQEPDELSKEFWEKELACAEALQFPSLPPSYQPAANSTSKYHIQSLEWPSNSAPSTIIQAACSLLIGQYTNSQNVIFGTTINSNHRTVLPIQAQLNWDSYVSEFIENMERYKDSLIKLAEFDTKQMLEDKTNGTWQRCQFQLILIAESDADKVIQYMRQPCTSAMTIFCIIHANGASLHLHYDAVITNSLQARRILHQLGHIVQQLCTVYLSTRLANIEMTSERDKEQIWAWNGSVPKSVNACIHDLISHSVLDHPNATAVHAWDGILTYADLEQKSSILANWLRCKDVGVGTIVPICFEKSVWTTITILAIAKAGGTFLALDRDQPQTRLLQIVQDVKATFILCTSITVDLANTLSSKVYIVDENAVDAVSAPSKDSQPKPSDILYVVYTSGSTGTPKGLLISHENLCSTATYQAHALSFNKDSRSIDYSSYSFDAYIFNTFYTLIAGGCLCVPSDADRVNDINSTLQTFKVNLAQLTPSVARLLDPNSIPDLHTLILTGEKLGKSDILPWIGRARIVNAYGPSECTIMCAANVNIATPTNAHNIGTGLGSVLWIRSLINTSSLAPVGVIGEIMIEGPGVGQGYLGDEFKTEPSYIHNPPWLNNAANGRSGRKGVVFKTGDLARYNDDGSLTFLGRADAQIKLHGQRIETGEVEYHLRHILPEGFDCVVDVVDISPTARQLLCFLQVQGKHDLHDLVAKVKKDLLAILPRYMVPTAFLSVDHIPMTASGKIDRKTLKQAVTVTPLEELIDGEPRGNDRVQKPRTTKEVVLQQLWKEVLGAHGPPIGINDSFFRRGGDSIAAMKLVAASLKRGYSLTVPAIFRKPRLCDLAQEMSDSPDSCRDLSADQIPPFSLLPPDDQSRNLLQHIATACGIGEADIEDIYPCSPLQEGMLAVTAKRPGNFIMREIITLPPTVNIDRAIIAWKSVVSATSVLRTRVVDSPGGGLLQVVLKATSAWSLSMGTEDFLEPQKPKTFLLGVPLARFAFLTLSNGDHALVLTMHHSLYDAWSMDLLLKQYSRAYEGKEIMSLAPYRLFIKHIVSADTQLMEKFWDGALATVEAPQFPSLPNLTYQPATDATAEHQIRDLQWPSSDITPSTLIRAACSILISQHTNSNDTVFGATVIGRQAPIAGVEHVVGPTIATVPIRIEVDWNSDVQEFLSGIQTQALDMIPFEHFGLSNIRRLNSGAEQACQFQLLLVIQPAENENVANEIFKHHVAQEEIHAFNTHAILIVCFLQPSGLSLRLSFDTKVVDSTQAQGIALQMDHILRQLCSVNDTATKLVEMDVVSDFHKEQIWNLNSSVPETVNESVHDLIALKVSEQPDATAICAWDGDLTYQGLWLRANELAHTLRQSHGVKAETMVPLCFEKSVWAPVAMLGVILAGGIGVALDPSQPEERLKAIMLQTESNLILTSDPTVKLAHALTTNVIAVNSDFFHGKGLPSDAGSANVQGSNGVFIVFTSGSTGTPKGIVITHSNFSSALKHQSEVFGMTKSTRVLDFASYTFDVAWFNLLHTLNAGACLCIPSEADRKDNLVGTIKDLDANYLFLTPSLGRHLDSSSAPGLKDLIFGAEPVSRDDISGWSSDVRIRIGYGPAECTVMSNVATIGAELPTEVDTGPGYGLNCWIISCLQEDALAPFGAIGELVLEGPLIGRGYLGEAEKAAVAFIDSPKWLTRGTSSHPGRKGRIYKSGDLARYTPEGAIVIMGRKDGQVKIRGQRVELEEIEAHTRRLFPEFQTIAAQVITPLGAKSRVLVLFIVSEQLDEASITPLSQSLAKVLPSYMVPSAFIPLPSMPMTPTGKVSRRQLQDIGASMSIEQFFYSDPLHSSIKREPRNPIERQLQQIWADVLGLAPSAIGIDDNFIQIGGDSVLAMRVTGMAHDKGLRLSVATIFRKPCLVDIAEALSTAKHPVDHINENDSNPNGDLVLPTVQAMSKKLLCTEDNIMDIHPVTEFQQHCVECSLFRPRAEWGYFSVTFETPVDIGRLKETCFKLYETVEIFRVAFAQVNGKYFQAVVKDIQPYVSVRDVGESLDSATRSFCEQDVNESPSNDSFTAFAIIRNKSEGRVRLIIRMSHAHYDGISIPKIAATLGALYDGVPAPRQLPFSSFMRTHRQNTAESHKYWKNALDGSSMTLLSRNDKESSTNKIPSTVRIKLRGVATIPKSPKGVTAATIFFASWGLMLSRLTGLKDIVFGRLVSGRNSVSGQNHNDVIGPCINFVPVRMKLDERLDATGILTTLQNQFTNGLQHEAVSVSEIADECTDWAPNTKFGSIVQFQNIEDQPCFSIGGERVQFKALQDSPEADAPGAPRVTVVPVNSCYEIELSVPASEFDVEQAQGLLDGVCRCLKTF